MELFLAAFLFYVGCVIVAAFRIWDRSGKETKSGGYDPEPNIARWHEHYHYFLYSAVLAVLLDWPFLHLLGAPALIDEAFIHRPHEFAWGRSWFWKSTVYGLYWVVLWVLLELFWDKII